MTELQATSPKMSQIIDVSPSELSGVFETDYADIARKFNEKPFALAKFGLPLPPLPAPYCMMGSYASHMARSADNMTNSSKSSSRAGSGGRKRSSVGSSGQPVLSSLAGLSGISESRPSVSVTIPETNNESGVPNNPPAPSRTFSKRPGSGKNRDNESNSDLKRSQLLETGPRGARRSTMIFTSRYKFTPTIAVENDEDDEVYKIEVRGWKVPQQQMDILCAVIPGCPTITNLTLWNCGLTTSHYKSLCQLLLHLSVNIRVLSIDQNGPIPENCIATLLSEETGIKNLSLRGNAINDTIAKQIAAYLKTNRVMTSLDLFDNKIGKEGAEAFAEALKLNTSLQALNLGRNHVGNEGANVFAKALSNFLLSAEELQNRRKQIAELERIRQEVEDDASKKKGARAVPGRGASAKEDKKEDSKKRTTKLPNKKELPAGRSVKTPEDSKTKKAASATSDDKKSKDKKTALATKGAKKGKSEETAKDDQEENGEVAVVPDPMFEVNGQWFVIGNRSLNSLNLVHNNITEAGLKALFDAVNEQEATADQLPDGLIGIIRVSLLYNGFSLDHPLHIQLQSLLNTRNPFFEDATHDGLDGVGGDVDDTESNLEEVLS